MMEHKRSPVSVEQGSLTSLTPKRHKAGLSISSKERKEKVGERIAALQQLVSPYGKTDTASVLLEAMEYIRFLHEQVKEIDMYNLKSKGLRLVPISYTMGVASSNGADIWAPIKTNNNSPKT
ncbi:Myc-type, basic helix-loop-helix (bHLH) domain-containing protein [Cynara cardunculus var. scolymus]|uniref:Myc-type, basic helix-loop-helix (BHLH) domain-containing protein n=1 Tax=Cynara cardunculus var. scolymus TaxID=59895 RepID=A0A124SEK0_CYNCS|nr:Myc-type, basic helix-loop-helix (bHLH) domain-containing protein [Cynara cardunculus var. scolymus]